MLDLLPHFMEPKYSEPEKYGIFFYISTIRNYFTPDALLLLWNHKSSEKD